MFSWETATAQVSKLALYDLSGREMLRQDIPIGTLQTEIDVSHLPNGMYGYKIYFGENRQTGKIVVEK